MTPPTDPARDARLREIKPEELVGRSARLDEIANEIINDRRPDRRDNIRQSAIAMRKAAAALRSTDSELARLRWTEWNGGACPLNETQLVELKIRNGMHIIREAGRLNWYHAQTGTDAQLCTGTVHLDSDNDIIAYRLIYADSELADELARLRGLLVEAGKALGPVAAFWNAYHAQSRFQRADGDIWDEIDADGPYAAVTFGDLRLAAATADRIREELDHDH